MPRSSKDPNQDRLFPEDSQAPDGTESDGPGTPPAFTGATHEVSSGERGRRFTRFGIVSAPPQENTPPAPQKDIEARWETERARFLEFLNDYLHNEYWQDDFIDAKPSVHDSTEPILPLSLDKVGIWQEDIEVLLGFVARFHRGGSHSKHKKLEVSAKTKISDKVQATESLKKIAGSRVGLIREFLELYDWESERVYMDSEVLSVINDDPLAGEINHSIQIHEGGEKELFFRLFDSFNSDDRLSEIIEPVFAKLFGTNKYATNFSDVYKRKIQVFQEAVINRDYEMVAGMIIAAQAYYVALERGLEHRLELLVVASANQIANQAVKRAVRR